MSSMKMLITIPYFKQEIFHRGNSAICSNLWILINALLTLKLKIKNCAYLLKVYLNQTLEFIKKKQL